jgi:hypothetical protein
MFDMIGNPDDIVVLAQAQTPPALVAPAPNWISDYPNAVKGMVREIQELRRYQGLRPESLISYSENGPLGIPALIWKTFDIEFSLTAAEDDISKLHPIRHTLNLASHSCRLFDFNVGQAGAWGPECKVVRFIELPEGQMDTPNGAVPFNGDCWYTPVGAGMDKVRFILENGAGRQIDVTVYIDVMERGRDTEGDR